MKKSIRNTEWVEVESSNIQRVRHNGDDKNPELQVEYKKGKKYGYPGVPYEKYLDLLKADSKGKFLQNLKELYPYRAL